MLLGIVREEEGESETCEEEATSVSPRATLGSLNIFWF